ncbi:MAG: hypothetical protein Q7T26_11530 [Dehalococcoidia bacterium]|nr:hypothetical protein [Dehalococcoidia bacterium]
MRYHRATEIMSGMSLVIALAASLWLILWPYSYSYESISATSGAPAGGAPRVIRGAASLIEVNGPMALVPLSAPVALAALAFVCAQAQRLNPVVRRLVLWTVAILLSGFSVATGFSIGAFYVPAAMLSLTAAVVSARAGRSGEKVT